MLAAMDYSFNLNQVADIYGKHLSVILILAWMVVIPIIFTYVLLPRFRGNIRIIISLIFVYFILNLVLPGALFIRSAIYLGQLNTVYYSLATVFFLNMLALWLLEEKGRRYFYINDDIYFNLHLIKKGGKEKFIASSICLTGISVWVISFVSLFVFSILSYILAAICNMGFSIPNIAITLSGFMFLIHIVLLRWLVKCTHCRNPILDTKDDGNQLHKYWFIRVAWRVLRRKPFDCVWCDAHYSFQERGETQE